MYKKLTIPTGKAYGGFAIKAAKKEMLNGLMAAQKYLPSKFFYDEAGSRLFEQITELEEYYPSRIEKSILKKHAGELIRRTEGISLVEIGSGDCSKISILLAALPVAMVRKSTYLPIDISLSAIEECERQLQERFDTLKVSGIVSDFMSQIHQVPNHRNRIFCFFGSTIGNLARGDASLFVSKIGKLLNNEERLLLGLDMVKDKAVLEKAYNDEKGVTAQFNKNILNVTNKILETNFEPEYFQHHAFFKEEQQRIEMHLVATRDMIINSPFFEDDLRIQKGETIHTENSHKFLSGHIDEFASASGLSVGAVYTDSNNWFTLVDYVKFTMT